MTAAALVFASLVLGSPPGVEVQRPGAPPQWSLDWRASAECPDRAALVELVDGYAPGLEPPVEAGERSRVRVVASVVEAEGPDPWFVTLEIAGPLASQTREFSASSCAEASRATALIAAVLLEPVLVANTLEEPEPEPPIAAEIETAPSEIMSGPNIESTTSAQPSEASVVVHEPEPKPRRPRVRPRIGLSVSGGGGYGPTDAGWLSGGIGLAVFSGLWRWELDGGGGAAPRFAGKDDASSVPDPIGTGEGRFRSWWVGTRGCVAPSLARARLELPVCIGIELGEVGVQGIEPTTNPELQRQLWSAGSLGVGTNWVLIERLALTLDFNVLVPISRGDFVIDEAVAGSFAPVGLRAGLGIEVRL